MTQQIQSEAGVATLWGEGPTPLPAAPPAPASARRANFVACVREHAIERAGETAFAHFVEGKGDAGRTTLTFLQLDRRARAIAAQLQGQRLAGRNIVLAYPPGVEFIAAFFGVLYAGCVAVPAYLPRPRTLDHFLALVDDAGAPLVLTTAEALQQINAINGGTEKVRCMATDEIADADAERWIEHSPDSAALAMIQYTSGSTSRPKGVMLTHANLIANARDISAAFGLGPDTRTAFWLPAFHDMGLIGGTLVPVYCGIPNIIIAPTLFVRKPLVWLQTISRFRTTVSGGPNFAYDLCVRKVTAEEREKLDLSSWSLAFIGAETVEPATLDRFAEAFAPCGFRPESFYPCYGLAEATLMVSGGTPGRGATVRAFADDALAQNRIQPLSRAEPGARNLVGCGAAVGALRVAIVDATTCIPAAPDRVGEIWVAGDSISQGYWRSPGKTTATFRGRLNDPTPGPYLRTGDLGFMHDNELYITGRIDDLIIVRGLNHHPQDLEATARRCHPQLVPGLGAAFAFKEHGVQRLVLVHEVVQKGSSDLAPIADAVRAAVLGAHGVVLDDIVLIRCGTIAKTTSGKIQRQATCAAFRAGKLRFIVHARTSSAVAPPSLARLPAAPMEGTALAAVCQHALAM